MYFRFYGRMPFKIKDITIKNIKLNMKMNYYIIYSVSSQLTNTLHYQKYITLQNSLIMLDLFKVLAQTQKVVS